MTRPIDDGSFQYRHCLKKKAYGTEALAREIIANVARRKHTRVKLDCYQCKLCHFWHLTSRVGRAVNG